MHDSVHGLMLKAKHHLKIKLKLFARLACFYTHLTKVFPTMLLCGFCIDEIRRLEPWETKNCDLHMILWTEC